jgi:hypothetical protein
MLEAKVGKKQRRNVKQLKRALRKAWDEIDVETLRRSVEQFPKRLQACIDAKGDHFEFRM